MTTLTVSSLPSLHRPSDLRFGPRLKDRPLHGSKTPETPCGPGALVTGDRFGSLPLVPVPSPTVYSTNTRGVASRDSSVTIDTSKARSTADVVRRCIRSLGWKEVLNWLFHSPVRSYTSSLFSFSLFCLGPIQLFQTIGSQPFLAHDTTKLATKFGDMPTQPSNNYYGNIVQMTKSWKLN